MENKELVQRFIEVFDSVIPIIEDVKKGFFTQNHSILEEGRSKFEEAVKSRVPYAEKIIEEKDKDETAKKYVDLFITIQSVALAVENLINKMKTKVELKILFSEKALSEIRELYDVFQTQLRDTRDYILTRNPHLKEKIMAAKERLIELAREYDLVHQQRLITGICMPKASYLYIDMTDSLKRIARGLADFAEKA